MTSNSENNIPSQDLSRSGALLSSHCRNWLKKRYETTPWLPSQYYDVNFTVSHREHVDVILFGDFVRQLMKTDQWPKVKYRLWTLGSASKNICAQILGLPENSVGVIPRYDLFAPARNPSSFPGKDDAWTLVFGGRLSQSKNLDLVLRVTSSLQVDFNENVSLVCFGGWDNVKNIYAKDSPISFFEETTSLIKSLPWKKRPRFGGLKQPQDWLLGTKLPQPVFISLSTFFMEDFGVSAAQAQQIGWPCILTDWGGHQDVVGKNVIKIRPDCLIPKKIARAISERQKANYTFKSRDFREPRFLSSEDLTEMRNRLVARYTPKILALAANKPNSFSNSKRGRFFFSKYLDVMGNVSPS